MARAIAVIKKGMTDEFIGNTTIQSFYGLDVAKTFEQQFSPLSLESLLLFIVASAIYVLETLQDTLKSDVDTSLNARLIPNRTFLRNLALAFQYGDDYNEESGKYDVVNTAKRIVAFADVEEPIKGGIILKVARLVDDKLAPLDALQYAAFAAYMKVAKPMGIAVTIISIEGDDLRLVLDIYYNPLLLDADGNRLDGGGKPVPETVSAFLKNLTFNGEFVLASLVDKLQVTSGVAIPTVLSAESKYLSTDFKNIDARVKPYAGYLNISNENLTITYRPYDVD